MGTPRASVSLDQMSRMQINASVGGECAPGAALKGRNCSEADSVLGGTITGNATDAAFTS